MICKPRNSIHYYPIESALLAECKMQNFRQHNGMTVADYYKGFTMVVKIARIMEQNMQPLQERSGLRSKEKYR